MKKTKYELPDTLKTLVKDMEDDDDYLEMLNLNV
jgi:hypothetical protein